MEENQSFLDLQVDPEASASLTEATKWGKFLAIGVIIAFILSFTLIALMWSVIAKLFMDIDGLGTTGDAASLGMVFLISVLGFCFIIFAILFTFLIKAANRIRNGLRAKDQFLFNSGLASLRNYFTMYGVLSVLGLVFAIIGHFKN